MGGLGASALLLTALSLLVSGCSGGRWLARRSAGPVGVLNGNSRQEPALSGQGRFLASVVDRGGLATLLLQEQPSGRIVPLRHFQNRQPHSSPSLSWNGRYVAALVQLGNQRLALIEDHCSHERHSISTARTSHGVCCPGLRLHSSQPTHRFACTTNL